MNMRSIELANISLGFLIAALGLALLTENGLLAIDPFVTYLFGIAFFGGIVLFIWSIGFKIWEVSHRGAKEEGVE